MKKQIKLTKLSFWTFLVRNSESSGHKSELAKVLLQLGVVDAVLETSDENRFGLMTELDPRPRQLDANPLSLDVMLAAEDDPLDDAVVRKVDEPESLFNSGRLVGTLDGPHDLSEGRKILNKIVFGDRLLQGRDEDAPLVLALVFELDHVLGLRHLELLDVRLSESRLDLAAVDYVIVRLQGGLGHEGAGESHESERSRLAGLFVT